MRRVNELLLIAAREILLRASSHDSSKLLHEEKEAFDEYTPKLKDCTYGSEEYKGFLSGLGVALKHHYQQNSHHPEHYENGLNGFDLFDLIEHFFDCKAASERHENGDILESIRINKARFGYSDQVESIFKNTVERYL